MVHVSYQNIDYPVAPGETVLDALINGGADVRYSCRRGRCLTCMLQCTTTELSALAGNRLPATLTSAGMFLPCISTCTESLHAAPPDWTSCFAHALVTRTEVLDGMLHVTLELPLSRSWRAGQQVQLQCPDGTIRRHCITSVHALDFVLGLQVPLTETDPEAGGMKALRAGDLLPLKGPLGDCHYRESLRGHPLLLLGDGPAAGALLAIAREARLLGHTEQVELVLPTLPRPHLVLELEKLRASWSLFQYDVNVPLPAAHAELSSTRISAWPRAPRDWGHCALFVLGAPTTVQKITEYAKLMGTRDGLVHWDFLEGPPR